jgi:hypothetical protein
MDKQLTALELRANLDANARFPGDPMMKSIYEALMIVMFQPNTLIRITAKNLEETIELANLISHAVTGPTKYMLKGADKKNGYTSKGERGPILEFINGSGIELALPTKQEGAV